MENWMQQVNYALVTGVEGKFQYHIQCGPGDIAPIAIVPGDQGRVAKIIEHIDGPVKIAENRGLITYKGTFDGIPVSVTSTGMGGPAAGIVYEELINLGAKVLLRIGSMAAIQPDIARGDISIPVACVRDDGLTPYYVPENYPAVDLIDEAIGKVMENLEEGDVLIINGDHGCDPVHSGTDHTREYVPLIWYEKGRQSENLGIRESFADMSQSLSSYFNIPPMKNGKSFREDGVRDLSAFCRFIN